jgi:hypothetical protein
MLEDISALTTIPLASLEKIFNKGIMTICDDVEDTLNHKENECEVDIGIGKMRIQINEENIKYKFIPSGKLEKQVLQTVQEGKNPLETQLEAELSKRIMNVYKELF